MTVTTTVRFARPEEIATWNELIQNNPHGGEITNTLEFGIAKATLGWIPRHLVFETAGEFASADLVLERPVPLLGKFWFLPAGPAAANAEALAAKLRALRDFARQQVPGVFFITADPNLTGSQAELAAAVTTVQTALPEITHKTSIRGNADTAVVSLAQSPDELLMSFDKKCRNMVRRAQRDGVIVKEVPVNQENKDHMHRLMRLVGGGKGGLTLRSPEYYEVFWDRYSAAGIGKFYAIYEGDTPTAMAFVVQLGERAIYKDGGSERPRTTPGTGNILQWHAMREAQDAGAVSYDLFGIAPEWAKSNEDHPSYALGLFKLGFSRERTVFVGAFDLPIKPLHTKLWRTIGERVLARWHRRKYNDSSLY